MQEMKAVSDAFEIKTCESEANGTFTIGLGFDINDRTGSEFASNNASFSWNRTIDVLNFNAMLQGTLASISLND
jgi:hypothetical protein